VVVYMLSYIEIKQIRELSSLPWFTNLGITNPTLLKNNLVLEISKNRDVTSLVLKFSFPYGLGTKGFVPSSLKLVDD
jgi:hypothetical protein